jgi:WD40 repeat protein
MSSVPVPNEVAKPPALQKPLRRLRGHTDGVACITSSKIDPWMVATGGEDRHVRVWDVRTGDCVGATSTPTDDAVTAVEFDTTTRGRLFAGCGIRVMDLMLGKRSLSGTCASSSSSSSSSSSGNHGEPSTTPTPTPLEQVARMQFNVDEVASLAVHDTLPILASADDEGCIAIVRTDTRALVHLLRKGHSSLCSCIVFRPTCGFTAGTTSLAEAVSGGFDNTVVCWNATRGVARSSVPLAAAIAEALQPPLSESTTSAQQQQQQQQQQQKGGGPGGDADAAVEEEVVGGNRAARRAAAKAQKKKPGSKAVRALPADATSKGPPRQQQQQQPAKEPAKEPAVEPGKEPAKEPGKEPAQASADAQTGPSAAGASASAPASNVLPPGLGGSSGGQLFNPPFVHAVAFSNCGAYVAAALGDGTVAVCEWDPEGGTRPLKPLWWSSTAHTAAATCVGFVAHSDRVDVVGTARGDDGEGGGGGGGEHDTPVSRPPSPSSVYLFSAGNDAKLCGWLWESVLSSIRERRAGLRRLQEQRAEGSQADFFLPPPFLPPTFTIKLARGPNWVVGISLVNQGASGEKSNQGYLLVADTKSDVRVYSLPVAHMRAG